ncbi:hypothetical protein C8R46DRAFT_279304 [Mycena filopes]|nr:hypothetical protein C8R46DRAFT_279304 [Mycena filopes]
MGRWTVAEWLAQAQEQSPLPVEEQDYYGCPLGINPVQFTTLHDNDTEDSFEDDFGDGKALPPIPGASVWPYHGPATNTPPTPPPKPRLSVAIPVTVQPPGPGKERSHPPLNVAKNDRMLGVGAFEKPARTPDRVVSRNYYPRNGPQHLATPTRSLPRSPDTYRPREFSARSGVKRTASKSKSTPKVKSKVASFGRTRREEATVPAQGLQIFVSTQTTATRSAPDAGRPRVYYPRSSSLPGFQRIAKTVPVESLPPTPPAKSPIKIRSSRALPMVPENRAASVKLNTAVRRRVSQKGSPLTTVRRIRPLPIPVLPPTYTS